MGILNYSLYYYSCHEFYAKYGSKGHRIAWSPLLVQTIFVPEYPVLVILSIDHLPNIPQAPDPAEQQDQAPQSTFTSPQGLVFG